MNDITHGMNVDVVRDVARGLLGRSQEIQRICGDVDALVAGAGQTWKGTDSLQFAGKWRNSTRAALNGLAENLAELARTASANADAQERESSSLGHSASELFNDPVAAGWFDWIRAEQRAPVANVTPIKAINELLDLSLPGALRGFDIGWALGKLPVPGLSHAVDGAEVWGLWTDPDASLEDMVFGTTGAFVDTAAGAVRSIGVAAIPVVGAPAYLFGVAASQVWDVVDLTRQADFSEAGRLMVFDFIMENPREAAEAALDGVVGYFPKLISNFWPL